jgi:hypothetical protein
MVKNTCARIEAAPAQVIFRADKKKEPLQERL